MDHNHTLPTFRIAVVDDYPADVYVLQRALQRTQLPFILDHFADGEEAVQAFWQQGAYHDAPHPDLIVLDLHLRRGSGADVLQRIRAHPVLCRVPVIVWTGHSVAHARLIVGEVAVDAYVTKTSDPVVAMAIGTLIKDVLTAQQHPNQSDRG